MAMRRGVGAILSFAMSVAVGACVTTPQTSAPSAAAPLAITDLKSLVGTWEGLGQGPSSGSVLGGHTADWVELTIKEDGTYEARSYREIGVFRGTGRLTLSDNVVHWRSDRSSGVLYLIYDQGGKRVLRLQGQLASGAGPVSAELTLAR
jgi:hypothetical protein